MNTRWKRAFWWGFLFGLIAFLFLGLIQFNLMIDTWSGFSRAIVGSSILAGFIFGHI